HTPPRRRLERRVPRCRQARRSPRGSPARYRRSSSRGELPELGLNAPRDLPVRRCGPELVQRSLGTRRPRETPPALALETGGGLHLAHLLSDGLRLVGKVAGVDPRKGLGRAIAGDV